MAKSSSSKDSVYRWVYIKIVDLPGSIFEFRVRYGSNLVLFENLRQFVPYNYTRKVVGFDTFEGYANLSRMMVTVT